jgi:hypothetical protein
MWEYEHPSFRVPHTAFFPRTQHSEVAFQKNDVRTKHVMMQEVPTLEICYTRSEK